MDSCYYGNTNVFEQEHDYKPGIYLAARTSVRIMMLYTNTI